MRYRDFFYEGPAYSQLMDLRDKKGISYNFCYLSTAVDGSEVGAVLYLLTDDSSITPLGQVLYGPHALLLTSVGMSLKESYIPYQEIEKFAGVVFDAADVKAANGLGIIAATEAGTGSPPVLIEPALDLSAEDLRKLLDALLEAYDALSNNRRVGHFGRLMVRFLDRTKPLSPAADNASDCL